MSCFEPGITIDLAKRENLPLHDVRGTLLRVTRGSLWVTQENDPRDLVLRTGDTWTVERDGLTIVEAQADSIVCVGGRNVDAVLAARRAGRSGTRSVGDYLRRAAAAFFAPPSSRAVPYF